MTTSADRDAWLSTLIVACDSAAARTAPVTAAMLAACERHLRDNARANVAILRSLH